MSRRRTAVKRLIKVDTNYDSLLLSRFINKLMKNGKKSLAQKIVYKAFERIKVKHQSEPMKAFLDCINNVKPFIEVRSMRVGGANYQVPSPVNERRGYALATKWIINSALKRSSHSMVEKLADELFDAANNRGMAVKKKEDTHKMAESNRAFAHFIQRNS